MARTLHPVAWASADHADFGPFVAAIGATGSVAFTSRLPDGSSDITLSADGATRCLATSRDGLFAAVTSHPALDDAGDAYAYVELDDGASAVLLARAGACEVVSADGARLAAIGPLGPTVNSRGLLAFRATDRAGAAGVYRLSGGRVARVATTSDGVIGFEGLPLACEDGAVVYRVSTAGGGAALRRGHPGATAETIAQTGEAFRSLTAFPTANRAGVVAFSATDREGVPVACLWSSGTLVDTLPLGARFDSIRTALVIDAGDVLVAATPPGGTLGLYERATGFEQRIIGIGDTAHGRTVAAFVLNDVSTNAAGQLALRVQFEDGAQAIVRSDP